jgi:hypothetical protein
VFWIRKYFFRIYGSTILNSGSVSYLDIFVITESCQIANKSFFFNFLESLKNSKDPEQEPGSPDPIQNYGSGSRITINYGDPPDPVPDPEHFP